MTSILKVDQIQTAAGGSPTTDSLGISVTNTDLPAGNVLQRIRVHPLRVVAGTGEYGVAMWTTASLDTWHTPTYSTNPYQITFNAVSSNSKALIRAGGSVYGTGSGWVGLHRDAIVSSTASYVWPAWRNSSYSTSQNHQSFLIEREMDSSYLDGKTWWYQIFPHGNNTSYFAMYEDLFFEITEIAG